MQDWFHYSQHLNFKNSLRKMCPQDIYISFFDCDGEATNRTKSLCETEIHKIILNFRLLICGYANPKIDLVTHKANNFGSEVKIDNERQSDNDSSALHHAEHHHYVSSWEPIGRLHYFESPFYPYPSSSFFSDFERKPKKLHQLERIRFNVPSNLSLSLDCDL